MKYKLLLLDIDGTIIKIQENGHDLMPSEKIRNSICSAGKKIAIGFATGRSYKSVQPLIQYLGIHGLCVLNNGSQIIDSETGEIIFEKTIPTNIVTDILQRLTSYDVYLGSGKEEVHYTSHLHPERVVSIYFKIPLSEIQEVEIFLATITDISYHRFLTWENDFSGLYISHSLVSKGYGAQEMARILNLSLQSFIGVGDSYNDISMLEICGKKIAMGNAIPELKSIADYIAPSIDDDGIIDIINTFILSPSE